MRKVFVFAAAVMLCAGLSWPAAMPAAAAAEITPEAAAETAGPFDLNSVSFDELVSIPGIGPVLAERILDYRSRRHGFSRVDELLDIKGVGAKNFVKIRSSFTLSTPPPRVATTPLPTP